MSMTIITAEEINQLQAMFPDIDAQTIKKTFVKAGSMEETIQRLLSASEAPKPTKPTLPKTPVDDKQDDEDKPWNCTACTFENQAGAAKCAVCDTISPIKPKFTVPGWWASFWAEYSSQTAYSEEEAKIIVLRGGEFNNSRTFTLEVKKRVLKKLHIDEVHTGPIDDGGHTPFLPYPTFPVHPHPVFPHPSRGGCPPLPPSLFGGPSFHPHGGHPPMGG